MGKAFEKLSKRHRKNSDSETSSGDHGQNQEERIMANAGAGLRAKRASKRTKEQVIDASHKKWLAGFKTKKAKNN